MNKAQSTQWSLESFKEWQYLPLVVALLVAFVVRVGFMPDPAYYGDIEHFGVWADIVSEHGLLRYYDENFRMGPYDRTYPPLAMMVFQINTWLRGTTAVNTPETVEFVVLLKSFAVAAELALVALAFFWSRKHATLRWVAPLGIALFPAFVVITAWWGQHDAPFTLMLVAALLALRSGQPLWAWGLFALGVLIKQPAVPLGALLLILTFRRYGWQKAVAGLALSGSIVLLGFLPFLLSTNYRAALSPYLNAADAFPHMTNNAYNTWYAIGYLQKGEPLVFEEPIISDQRLLFGVVTLKQTGLIAFGAYVLGLLFLVWRRAKENYEFVWAAALYIGFFMLPTQVHERYLYPGAMLAFFGLLQEPRLWWYLTGIFWTFSYNILATLSYYRWQLESGISILAFPTALLNVILFWAFCWFILIPGASRPAESAEPSGSMSPNEPLTPSQSKVNG